jgi:hypothetical protein
MPGRISFAVSLALVLAAFAAAPAHGADSRYEGISAAGDVAFFSTVDRLVPGDTDTRRDIYERLFETAVGGYVTRQVSFGPTGGNHAFDVQYLATDAAGDEAFFSTDERLTALDKDSATDIYARDLAGNATTLVSRGDSSCAASGCGDGSDDASAVSGGVVADGERVFFASEEQLSSADADAGLDVYVRDFGDERTKLASTADAGCAGSECGNGPEPAFFLGASEDGTAAVFTTREALESADGDSAADLYRRDVDGAATTLVSTPNECPAGFSELECAPIFGGISHNGLHVFFESKERIAGADTDSSQDVYDWSGGTAALASQAPGAGNGTPNALYAGSSPNGQALFFETTEALVAADDDAAQDVYERSSGATSLVTRRAGSCEPLGCGSDELDAAVVRNNGIPSGVFGDGDKLFFFSDERLSAEDDDDSFDSYVRDLATDTTTLVSRADPSCASPECGNGPHDANFSGASADASHAFFVSDEALSPADTDSETDVYERSGSATTLVSVGTINGSGPYGAQLQGVSSDGTHAFFVTDERLTDEDDFLAQEDVYLRSASGTTLISQGNDAELESKLAPAPPKLESTDPPSPNASTEPRIVGSEAEAAALIKIYATADCSGEPIATGGAVALAAPGIPVTVASGSTTSFRATAEAEGFISSCSDPALTYKQEAATPPTLPEGGGSGGGGGGGGSGAGAGGGSGGTSSPAKTRDGVAYLTPVTRITFGPAFKTRERRPVFRFTDSTGQPDTKFVCRLDRRRWKPCGSPARLRGLHPGRHVFSVKGLNAVGAWEERPAKRRFKLVGAR